jgi:hypothetical protein
MNTIQITNSVGQTVNYTESEITMIIDNGVQSAKEYVKVSQQIREIRNEIRDFFSEGEWEDGEQQVSKSDVNAMLERIGAQKLTTIYGGSFTITGTFSNVDAEDEDEAKRMVAEEINVDFNAGDIQVDDISVDEIDENY